MKVTELQYWIDDQLLEKLDLMIQRIGNKRKGDILLIIEGAEGEGKTNMGCAVCKYVSYKTGRGFDNSNVFFDVQEMINFAQSTDSQILMWDEPALAGLSTEWFRETQRNLIKLLMVARKKRHFIVFNFTRFTKFNEYLVVDRPIGMIHMYSPDGIEVGRWAYFKKESLESLYYHWRRTRQKDYKKFHDFRGRIAWVLPKILNEESYEREKDKAILRIGVKEKKEEYTLEDRKHFILEFIKNWKEKAPKIKQKDLAAVFDVVPNTLRAYEREILPENT